MNVAMLCFNNFLNLNVLFLPWRIANISSIQNVVDVTHKSFHLIYIELYFFGY